MAKRNSIVLKSLRIPASVNDVIVEVSEELCFSKNDVIRLLLNRAVMQLKFDSIRAGGYKNLTFALKETK